MIACPAWPVVARISSQPRWLFFRRAILVTLALWLPDPCILARGQQAEPVTVLMIMRLAIALITYNCLVHQAKASAISRPAPGTAPRHDALLGPTRQAGSW